MRRLAALLLALGLPNLAHAAGYYVSDVGTRALGRGGAFVAAPDSLLALAYNPSALSLLRGAHLEVGTHLISFDYSFKRSCPCIDPANPRAAELDAEITQSFGGQTATNQAGPQVIPFLAAGYGLPFLDLTIALGAYGPASPRSLVFGSRDPQRAALQPQRYSLIDIELYEAYYTLGVALSPFEGFRIGATAALYDYATTQSAVLWANSRFVTSAEAADYDIGAVLDFSRGQLFNYGVGLGYDVLPFLSVGASFLGPRAITAPGTVEVSIPGTLADLGARVDGKDIEIDITLPPIVRAGVEVKIPSVLKAEAAFVLEMWGTFDQIKVQPKNVNVTLGGNTAPLTPVVLERNLSHTYSLRLGGELELFKPYLGVKAGYFYEPTASAVENLDPSVPDLDKHGLSVGVSTSWFGVTLELAAQYILLAETTVTNSSARMVGVLAAPEGSDEYLTTIGNGVYSGSYVIGSASLSVGFDEMLGLGEAE